MDKYPLISRLADNAMTLEASIQAEPRSQPDAEN